MATSMLLPAVVLAASIFVTQLDASPSRKFGGLFEPPEPEDHKYNVKLYGAMGDGTHNDTDAFLKAFRAASQAVNYSSVLVPAGHYLVWPMLFEDCVNTWLEVEGAIVAPQEPSDWPQNEYFIHFLNPNNCSIVGRSPAAEIEGNGMAWWTQAKAGETKAPSLIVFSGQFDGYPQAGVYNISLFNAPYAHIMASSVRMYSGPEVRGVKIRSTDQGESAGIMVSNASCFLEDLDIDVGGVNLAISTGYGDANRGFLRLDQSTLKRGGGIVITMTDGIMGNISLGDIDFVGTSHGLRALGAKDGSGELIGVFCDNLNMVDVGVPVLVSNMYCPESHKGCTRPAKGVSITMINLDRVSATQTSGSAGTFECSDAKPCSLSLYNVDIRPASPGVANEFHCKNAVGWTDNTVSPKSCLKKQGLSAPKPWQIDWPEV